MPFGCLVYKDVCTLATTKAMREKNTDLLEIGLYTYAYNGFNNRILLGKFCNRKM
jgi:hypothetical protein